MFIPFRSMFERHRAMLGATGTGAWVLPDGNPTAPVLIAAWQAEPGETAPFQAGHAKAVRDTLGQMGVPPAFVRLSYVVKNPEPRASPGGKTGRAGDLFFEEVAAGRHNVVILLGLDAARGVLRVPDREVEGLRRTRFTWPGRSAATFFVTHGTEKLDLADPLHQATAEFLQDLRAVFEVNLSQFDRARVLKG